MIYGIKVVVSGDVNRKMSSRRPTLIIANHQSRIDGFFIWSMAMRLGSLHKGRIVSKKHFTDIPVVGWAYDMAMHVFVRQNWDEDKETIRDTIWYYHDNALPVQLLLYPEGAALTESNRKKHQEFCRNKGLEMYNYITHPRTKGFVQCINNLKDISEFDIYDVTMGYIGKMCHFDRKTLEGSVCKKIF